MFIHKIVLVVVGIAIACLVIIGADYYSLVSDPSLTTSADATTTELPPTDESREFIIKGQFIMSLALAEYQLNPTPDNRDVLELMSYQYETILDTLCTDPGVAYSCTEASAFLEQVQKEILTDD